MLIEYFDKITPVKMRLDALNEFLLKTANGDHHPDGQKPSVFSSKTHRYKLIFFVNENDYNNFKHVIEDHKLALKESECFPLLIVKKEVKTELVIFDSLTNECWVI